MHADVVALGQAAGDSYSSVPNRDHLSLQVLRQHKVAAQSLPSVQGDLFPKEKETLPKERKEQKQP